MVSMNKLETGIARFLDAELISKMPEGGVQKIIAGTAISLMIKKTGKIIQSFQQYPMVQMMEIFDENGNLDVDSLADALYKNFPESGVKVEFPMVGTMTFHKEDVNKLYSYITE